MKGFITNMEQRSDAWYADRIGKLTSSEHYRLVAEAKRPMTETELKARPKGVTAKTVADPHLLSDGAITYIEEVVGEIMTGEPADTQVTTKDMEHGILYEPVARELYERVQQCVVTVVGSIPYDKLPKYVSGSPDGLIGTVGGVEFKCPRSNAIHLANLRLDDYIDLKNKRKEAYWQCISGMLINNRQWWDFVSFSPFYPTVRTQMKIIRIHRAQVMTDLSLLAIKLKYGVIEIENILEKLRKNERTN